MSTKRSDRLGLLLKLRRRKEDAAKAALTAAKNQADAIASLTGRLRQLRDARNAAIGDALHAGSPPVAMDAYRHELVEIGRRLAQQNQRLRLAASRLQRRRASLSEAHKQRKAMETCRNRLDRQAAVAEARAETKNLDDLHQGRRPEVDDHAEMIGTDANAW